MTMMDRRGFLQIMLAGASFAGLPAFVVQDRPDLAAPVHLVNNDPGWVILNGATIGIDEKRGLMTAAFTDAIRSLDGADFRIGGFMLPFDTNRSFRHFALTRRNSSCPFCPPNAPTEAIEIFADADQTFTTDEYFVSGRFQIMADSTDGLFYRLADAKVGLS